MLDHQVVRRHFKRVDPVLHKVVQLVGPMTLKPQRNRFQVLVGSILSQQISTAAARTIRARLVAHIAPHRIRPETVGRLSVEELRALGISRQKASYLLDLAEKCRTGDVSLAQLGRMTDEDVIAELTQVKGIGRWSAQMFLMFSLGRPDVFPYDDLGIRQALRRLYGFCDLPNKQACLEIGERWRPYATAGSWYCWRYLEHAAREAR